MILILISLIKKYTSPTIQLITKSLNCSDISINISWLYQAAHSKYVLYIRWNTISSKDITPRFTLWIRRLQVWQNLIILQHEKNCGLFSLHKCRNLFSWHSISFREIRFEYRALSLSHARFPHRTADVNLVCFPFLPCMLHRSNGCPAARDADHSNTIKTAPQQTSGWIPSE